MPVLDYFVFFIYLFMSAYWTFYRWPASSGSNNNQKSQQTQQIAIANKTYKYTNTPKLMIFQRKPIQLIQNDLHKQKILKHGEVFTKL